MKVGNISSFTSNMFKKIANLKPMKTVCKQYQKDNVRFISGVALTSIALKDALGCVFYVYQSLNNEKIPKEKRSFVAALDLANGGLMIAAQILAYMTISKKAVQQKMFNKFFGKMITPKFKQGVITKLQNSTTMGKYSEKHLSDKFDAYTNKTVDAFGFLTSLVASTILAKRVVVPFLATPLATYLKDNFLDKKNKCSSNKS